MDFILSKIISRPPRSDRDNCDNATIKTTTDYFDSESINNGFSDEQQLSSDPV